MVSTGEGVDWSCVIQLRKINAVLTDLIIVNTASCYTRQGSPQQQNIRVLTYRYKWQKITTCFFHYIQILGLLWLYKMLHNLLSISGFFVHTLAYMTNWMYYACTIRREIPLWLQKISQINVMNLKEKPSEWLWCWLYTGWKNPKVSLSRNIEIIFSGIYMDMLNVINSPCLSLSAKSEHQLWRWLLTLHILLTFRFSYVDSSHGPQINNQRWFHVKKTL